jgi:hypothetical protein
MAVSTRRWTQRGRVWFAVAGLDDVLSAAAERAGFQRVGDEWARSHPENAPHLARAWTTFTQQVEPMLRQTARQDPVPWQEALREVCRRTEGSGIDWWLTGSAALAVRGAPVWPGDLDLVCAVEDVQRLGDTFADVLIDPVSPTEDEADWWISDWFGRAFCHARVEWIAGVRAHADQPEPSDYGAIAAAALETVRWEQWRLRVPPLSLQRAVSSRRGLADRVAAIDSLDKAEI